MLISARKWKVWATSVVVGVVVCLVGPTLSWGVTVNGKIGLADKANNQPTLKIQITGVLKPGTATGGFDFDHWDSSPWIKWWVSDANPPPYTLADDWGNFTLPIRISFDPVESIVDSLGGMTQPDKVYDPSLTDDLGIDFSSPAGGARPAGGPHLVYDISGGYGGFISKTWVFKKYFYQNSSGEFININSEIDVFDITIPNFDNFIDWWKEDFPAQQAGQKFEQETGNSVTNWELYWGDGIFKNSLNTAWGPAEGIRNDFNWSAGVSDYWIGSENNAVTNTAPAQGLSPHTWAIEEDASPVAILYFRRSHHE